MPLFENETEVITVTVEQPGQVDLIEVAAPGPQGIPGPQGPAGATGPAGPSYDDTALAGRVTDLETDVSALQGDVTALDTELDGKASATHTHTATDISNSTTVGRSVITAADAAAARTAIGAGTSSLAIGTTSTTAAAGDHTHSSYVTNGANVSTITKITQAAYDALGSKDAATLYVIVG